MLFILLLSLKLREVTGGLRDSGGKATLQFFDPDDVGLFERNAPDFLIGEFARGVVGLGKGSCDNRPCGFELSYFLLILELSE